MCSSLGGFGVLARLIMEYPAFTFFVILLLAALYFLSFTSNTGGSSGGYVYIFSSFLPNVISERLSEVVFLKLAILPFEKGCQKGTAALSTNKLHLSFNKDSSDSTSVCWPQCDQLRDCNVKYLKSKIRLII